MENSRYKFRAWNEIDKTMLDWSVVKPQLSALLDSKYYVVMQFAGLKDKDGVEICEGDILGGHLYALVMYCNKCGGFELFFYGACGKCSGDVDLFREYEQEDLEVIGNIYENHNLLDM